MPAKINIIRFFIPVLVFLLGTTQGCGTLLGKDAEFSAPTGITVSSANRKLTVSWGPVEGSISYNLYYSASSNLSKETGIKVSQVTSPYTLKDLANNTTYYLAVSAENDEGETDLSSTAEAMPEARWVRLSEGENICPTDGILSNIAMSEAGDIYILCGYGGFEEEQHFDIRKWDGANWSQIGSNFERGDIEYPLWVNYWGVNLLVADDGTPWVAWGETVYHVGEIGVGNYYKAAYWDGGGWVQKGDTIDFVESDFNFTEISFAVNGSTPYLAVEHGVVIDGTSDHDEVYVYYWDGGQWAALGDRLDMGYGTTPQIAFDGGTPYVTWLEFNSTTLINSILIKYWDGSNWNQLGEGITQNLLLTSYSFVLYNGVPYLAWTGTETHVSKWNANDGTWTIDAYPTVDGIYSSYYYLVFIGSTPYVIGEYPADEYFDSYIFARYYDGTSWQKVNDEIEDNTLYGGGDAAISNGDTLCIFWNNTESNDNIDNYAGCVP